MIQRNKQKKLSLGLKLNLMQIGGIDQLNEDSIMIKHDSKQHKTSGLNIKPSPRGTNDESSKVKISPRGFTNDDSLF